MDENGTFTDRPRSSGEEAATAFLGLYLLVLAFFILLVSISNVEKTRSRAVMQSVSSAFASILPPITDLTQLVAREGELFGGQEFHGLVANLFATAIQVTRLEVVQPGRIMRLVIPADSLFVAGEARIRASHYPLLDRTVAALSGRPRGVRFDMEFVIGSPYVVGTSLPIGQTLETARAAVFAREMLSRGAPPDSLSIALKPGNPGEVALWFHVRTEEDARKRWAVDQPARRP